MKLKILSVLLILTIGLCSLSSCLLLQTDGILGGAFEEPTPSGNTINVNGGPTYENINITSAENKNLLAASKAVLSSVSVITTSAAGSGVIYEIDKERGEAYIITNYHVVYEQNSQTGIASAIKVFLYGMEATEYGIDATYVGGSMNYDIALLHVKGSTVLMESCARAADVADSDKVSILDTAIAIGNPEGNGISATVGYVNVDSENILVSFQGTNVQLRVMRTDAAVNSGNSGGGLFNDKGELIGIVNAKSGNSTTDNIGYAIPSNVAIAIAKNIKDYCADTNKTNVYRCMLGVTVQASKLSTVYDENTGKVHKIETVMIIEVSNEGAAVGYLQVNDVVKAVTIKGVRHEVTRTYHLVDFMLNARVGDEVVIHVERGGVPVDVKITMTEKMITAY